MRLLTIATTIALVAGGVGLATPAHAASEPFDPGHIVSDNLFFDGNAMSVEEIQNFLDSKVTDCSPKSQRPCLKDFRDDILDKPATEQRCLSDIDAVENQSAAQIISTVALACDVSPQALIVTLQKEQGLVTSKAPTESKYRKATGYACPDTADCNPEMNGFFNQVYWAARAFQAYRVNYNGNFGSYAPGTRNIKYTVAESCGAKKVQVQNLATSALYNYTPYTPNEASLANPYKTGDTCSSYGNRNFWLYYNAWFGNSLAGDYVLSNGATTVLTVGESRWELPLNSPLFVESLAPLDEAGLVSETQIESFTLRGALSPIIKSDEGDVFLLANGKRYALDGCWHAVDLGFACLGAPILSEAMVTRIPASPALKGTSSAWVQTPSGSDYILDNGQRREFADPELVDVPLGVKLVLDDSVVEPVTLTVPYVDNRLVQVRETKEFVVTTGAVSYRMPPHLVDESGAATWFGRSPGALSVASIELLTGITDFPLLYTRGGSSYLLGAAGGLRVTDPAEWSTGFAALDQSVASRIPDAGTISAPAVVSSGGAYYLVENGEKRELTMSEAAAASTGQETVVGLPSYVLEALPTAP